MKRRRFATLLLLGAAFSLLAFSSCPGTRAGRPNIVLVTIESLRADRLLEPAPQPDPLSSTRALAGRERIRPLMASSSDTLPSLVSLVTGLDPGQHQVLVDGIDRVPPDLPTLASLLRGAGYRTAGFPSLGSLGLASGLSRGFEAYGFPPSDRVGSAPLTATDLAGWLADGSRRPGRETVSDALGWVRRHREHPLFLWVHLSEAAPPYATDRELIGEFAGSVYDAALAYEDRCVKQMIDGFTGLGLKEETVFIVTGNHGESLGAHGETFHGQNLYPPSLMTAAAVVAPERRGGAWKDRPPGQGPGRLIDLFALILDMAGLAPPEGVAASSGLPSISRERPVNAATLRPRAAFGWPGRIARYAGDWAWFGPSEAELYRFEGTLEGAENLIASHAGEAASMGERAGAAAAAILPRLAGRPQAPSKEARIRLLELLRGAAAARERRDREAEIGALREAWSLDPGNFEVAKWLTVANGPRAREENARLRRELEEKGGGLQEALLALTEMLALSGSGAAAAEAHGRACAAGGDGCAIGLALRLARAGKHEEAADALGPVAEKADDPELWKTVGDLHLAVENTYRAGQAFEKAAALRPGDADILLRQGDTLAAARDFKGAEAKYEAARAVWPDLALVEMRLGVLAKLKGERSAAVEHFRKGLGIDTNTTAGAVALGRLLAEQGMTQEAIPLFLDAAARDPGSVDALYGAAEALAAEGRLDEAEARLRQALDRDPASGEVLYQLARLVVFKGNREEGNRLLEKLALHAPPGLALSALRDPLFANDAPGAPLAGGMRALYDVVRRATPEGQALIVDDPGEDFEP